MIWNKRWEKLKSRISIIQARIYKCSQKSNKKILVCLQKKIINNLESKYFSMYQVFLYASWKKINFLGKKTYFTLTEKLGLIQNLTIGAITTKKVNFFFNKKFTLSHLKKSVMLRLQEIIKQELVLLVIEPEWEAKFALHSYGFRKWCNIHFAIKAIFNLLKKFHSNVDFNIYTLNFNLNNYVDKVDHDYILRKLKAIPQITKQIKFWLRGGILKNVFVMQNEINQPVPMQSSRKLQNIGPFLINVAFHGIETNLKRWVLKLGALDSCKQIIKNNCSMPMVRYLDTFVIIHTNLSILQRIAIFLTGWVKLHFKISVSLDNCKVSESKQGFDFLGYHFIKIFKNGIIRIHIYPTKKSQKHLIWLIGEKCRTFRGISLFNIIEFLKPKMLSWAFYFRYVECSRYFKKMDYLIFLIVKYWLLKKSRQKGKKPLNENYLVAPQSYIFYGKSFITKATLRFLSKNYKGGRIENWNPKLSWIHSLYFITSGCNIVLYNWKNYWNVLTKKYGGFQGWQQNILKTVVNNIK